MVTQLIVVLAVVRAVEWEIDVDDTTVVRGDPTPFRSEPAAGNSITC
jgi:hypothetical protein